MKYSKELHDQLRKRKKDSDPAYVQCLLDEIERLQAERRWIPVSEKLPEDSEIVEMIDFYDGYFSGTGKDVRVLNASGVIKFWRKAILPEPPEEK